MSVHSSLPVGQEEARTRWNTHESGAAFDRKKTTYLTDEARGFVAQQGLCAIAGLGPADEVYGLLILGENGFVQTPDPHSCLLPLDGELLSSPMFRKILQNHDTEHHSKLGFFFINHPTKERLCVQGTAELLSDQRIEPGETTSPGVVWMALTVQQSFFHCAKYIRTKVPGLTTARTSSAEQGWRPEDLLEQGRDLLTETMCAFIKERVLCFLCTVDHHGQCAINHRGGFPGFLVTLPPHVAAPGGEILLPDYEGNGAFEAIGNIFETGKAALILPDYNAQLALCVSGTATVVEPTELAEPLRLRCLGAKRLVVLRVQHVELQQWT